MSSDSKIYMYDIMVALENLDIFHTLTYDEFGTEFLYINGEKHVIEITIDENINKYILKTVKFGCKDYRNVKQVKCINAVLNYIKRFY